MVPGGGHKKASNMVVIDLGAGYMDVFSFQKFNELCTYVLCTFMHMLYLNKILSNTK